MDLTPAEKAQAILLVVNKVSSPSEMSPGDALEFFKVLAEDLDSRITCLEHDIRREDQSDIG